MTTEPATGSQGSPPSWGSGGLSPACLEGDQGLRRRPRESEKAFAAFRAYVRMGPERSLAKLEKVVGSREKQLAKWSAKFGWTERVAEETARLARVEAEVAEAVVKAGAVDWVRRQEEQREEEWKVRCELLAMAREAIGRWKRSSLRCGSLEGIARLLELASKLGRLASGMATDRTEVKTEFEGQLDVDWEVALRKVYAEPAEVVDVEARRLSDGDA